MKAPLETSVETYLVDKVENVLGGMALKGDVPGRRFLDRIIILPYGVTIYCECKRPSGGRYSAHQIETLDRLRKMGHITWKLRSKEEIDMLVAILVNCENKRPEEGWARIVRSFCTASSLRAELRA